MPSPDLEAAPQLTDMLPEAPQALEAASPDLVAPPVTGGALGSVQARPAPSALSPIDQNIAGIDQKLQAERNHIPMGSPGSNHPGALGKIGHVLAGIGNIAGDIFAPGTMALIPGTQLHGEVEHNRLIGERQDLEGQKGKEAETGQEMANTAHLNQETQDLIDKPDKDHKYVVTPTAQGLMRFDPATGQTVPLTDPTGKVLSPTDKAGTVHETPSGLVMVDPNGVATPVTGSDGKQVQAMPKSTKPDTPEQQFIDEWTTKHPNGAIGDAIHAYSAAAQSPQRPPIVNIRTQDDKTRNSTFKAYTPALDSAERMNVMTKNYEDAVQNHNQQAMLSLLANHLGMTMGLQKGARMTKDIIREAQESLPYLQGLKAKFSSDGYLSGVTLSPEQMKQMVGLGQERFSQDISKGRSEARYMGATDDGPDRIPSASTINYYTHLAGGNPAKAKQLAATDGWVVK